MEDPRVVEDRRATLCVGEYIVNRGVVWVAANGEPSQLGHFRDRLGFLVGRGRGDMCVAVHFSEDTPETVGVT